ncbi:hypothetical protein NKG05_09120 [Oerskovia sp. M15]
MTEVLSDAASAPVVDTSTPTTEPSVGWLDARSTMVHRVCPGAMPSKENDCDGGSPPGGTRAGAPTATAAPLPGGVQRCRARRGPSPHDGASRSWDPGHVRRRPRCRSPGS